VTTAISKGHPGRAQRPGIMTEFGRTDAGVPVTETNHGQAVHDFLPQRVAGFKTRRETSAALRGWKSPRTANPSLYGQQYMDNSWQLGRDVRFRCNRVFIGPFTFVICELERIADAIPCVKSAVEINPGKTRGRKTLQFPQSNTRPIRVFYNVSATLVGRPIPASR